MSTSQIYDSNLAIVVLSYNHPELTARTVNSALKLHENVYLVHNGSEKRFSESLKDQFKNVQHLTLDKNRGYSGGVNFGLIHTLQKSEWVILLTNDCTIINLPEIPNAPAFVAPHILIQKTTRTDSLGGTFTPHLGQIFHCKTLNDFMRAAVGTSHGFTYSGLGSLNGFFPLSRRDASRNNSRADDKKRNQL